MNSRREKMPAASSYFVRECISFSPSVVLRLIGKPRGGGFAPSLLLSLALSLSLALLTQCDRRDGAAATFPECAASVQPPKLKDSARGLPPSATARVIYRNPALEAEMPFRGLPDGSAIRGTSEKC